MEGIIFYWLLWLAWIYSTFIMVKNHTRLKLSFVILLIIFLSNQYVYIGGFEVNVAYFIFLLSGYYLVCKGRKKIVLLIFSIATATFAYASMMLFKLYDPVWFVFDYRIMFSVIVGSLSLYLGKSISEKYGIFILSVCQGEYVYQKILSQFHNGLMVGGFLFLDMLVMGCSFMYLCLRLQYVASFIEQMVLKIQKQPKEKQG
ncbi:YphA family membrane protein [Bacillus weihaiensis]|uniref:YphA family membrane protein n=1 Tax=Bacillus weihaiensis TaxID=1547283 RepID=UPI0023550007|nr:hypothetical protein [Bacillus weihaiensis]